MKSKIEKKKIINSRKENDLRDTGIEAVGDMPWGTHFCQFYQSKQDLLDILVPYFIKGLRNKEYCTWVTSEFLTKDDAIKAMKKALPKFSGYLKKGQIEIFPYTDWYLKEGKFEVKRVLKQWVAIHDQALVKGYEGIRVSGNPFWIDNKKDWDDFTAYEAEINNIIDNYKMLVLCTYSLDKCNTNEVIDVVANHEFALIKRSGKWKLIESTVHKKTENALRQSDKRYRSTLDNMMEGCQIIGFDWRYKYLNDVAVKHSHLSREELIGYTMMEKYPGIEKTSVFAQLTKCMEKRIPQQNLNEFVYPDGSKGWFELNIQPVPEGIFILSSDITERKNTELTKSESEEKFRIIATNTPDHILIQDSDLRYVSIINPQLGLTEKEMIGKTDYDFLSHEDAKNLTKIKKKVLKTGNPEQVQAPLIAKDGSIQYFDGTYIPKRNTQGKVDGLIGYFRNVTESKLIENKLKEEKDFIDATLDVAGNLIVVLDNKARIIRFNKACEQITGYTAEEVLGKSFINIFLLHEEKDSVKKVFNNLIAGQFPNTNENYWVGKDKSKHLILWSNTAITEDNRKVKFIISSGNDVTESKKAEQTLKESEERLRLAQLSAKVGIWDWNIKNNKLEFTPELNQLYGLQPGAIKTYQDWRELTHPEDINRVEKSRDMAIVQHESFDIDFRIFHNSGEVRWINAKGGGIYNDKGKVERVFGINMDITDRKNVEKALKESLSQNEFLASVIEFSSQPFAVGYPDGKMGLMNKAFEELTGYTNEELQSINWAEVLTPPEWLDVEKEKLDKLHKTGLPIRYEKEYIRKNGIRVPIELLVHLVKDEEGKPLYYYSFLTDITERKQNEKKLLESEERFRTIAETVPVLLCITRTEDSIVMFTNEINNNAFGLRGEEIVGTKGPDYYCDPEDRTKMFNILKQKGAIDNYQLKVKKNDGTPFWIITSAKPIVYNGCPAMIGASIDITEYKKIEDGLKESEERFAKTFQSNPSALSISHLSDGKFVDVNESFLRLFEYNRNELIGIKSTDIKMYSDPIIRTRLVQLLKKNGKISNYEVNALTKSERPITTLVSAEKINIKGIEHILFSTLDITERKKIEEVLQSTLKKFYNILSGIHFGILLVTDENIVEFANQAFCEIFNLKDSPDSLLKLSANEIIDKIKPSYIEPDVAIAKIKEIVNKGRIVRNEETRMVGKRTYLRDFIPIYISDKKYGRLWIHNDITERKRAEEAKHESEEKFKVIATNTPDHIFIQDSNLRYVSVINPQLGLTEKEMIDKTDYDFLAKEDANNLTKIKKKVLKTGNIEHIVTPLLAKDGSTQYFEGSYIPRYNLNGKIDGILGYFRNITKNKIVEEELQRNEATLRGILDATKESIWLFSKDKRILMGNKIAVQRFGEKAKELVGKRFDEILPAELAKTRAASLKQVIDTGQPLEFEDEREGIKFHHSFYPVLGADGNVNYIACYSRDITQQKIMEEEIKMLAKFPSENPSPVLRLNKDGSIMYANEASKELLQNWNCLTGDLIPQNWIKEIRDSFKSGKHRTIEIGCNNKFFSFMIAPVLEQDYANMYGTDITENKIAAEKLKESEERFKAIAETTPVGIGVIDTTEGKFLYANTTYEKKFGYQKGELLGLTAPEIYWDTKDRDKILSKLKENGYVADYEVKLKRKDGTPFFGMSSVRPIAFGGKPALLGVFVDITERKIIEDALEKNTVRHEILSHIASKLLESSNPYKIVNELCMTVMEFLDCHTFFNFIIDEKVGKLHLNAYHGVSEKTASSIEWLEFGVAVCGCVARDGKRIIAENIPETPDIRTDLIKSFGIKAYCCHPLLNQGKVIGTLSFGTKSRTTFSKDDISLMKAVTDQVAIAMDRVRAEKELFDTKNYLESLINYANAPIIVWDPQNKIQLFNNAFANLTGYSSGEVIGKKIDFLFSEETLENAKEKIGQSLIARWESVEIPILCKNNEIRTILWNSANIYDIDNQTLMSTIAQGQDITIRRKVIKQLEDSQQKLELALENASIGIWVWDILTNAIEWDERMEKIFGLEPGSFGKSYDAFESCLMEEDIPHMRLALKKALEEEVAFETIYRIHYKEKDVKYINAKALLTKNKEGKAIKMTGVCFDITAMKKGAEETLFKLNEDLLRSNKDLEQFAYVASHDLQEPLRMVSSFTQLLSQRYTDKLDKNAQEFIQFAVDGAARMQVLINDLLTYSRVQTRGKEFSNVDMHSVLGNVINYLQLRIQEKNALVTNDELPSIYADEGQMIQLLQNLVGNALKFSGKMPVIHITSKEEKDYFVFSVKDNGIGIEPQYFNRIFQIFQRLHPKEEYSGTGIGLAICKRIVERHGGQIWVESELGLGTTFYFTILKNHII